MSVTGKPTKGELDFFAYQWSVEEDNESTMIRCYGVTKENKNVYVRIDNFTPYCYVELPTNIDWTESRIELVSNKLSNLNRKIYQPIRKEFVMRRKLYYAWKEKRKERKKKLGEDGKPEEGKVSMVYKDKLFPFLFLAFRSSSALRNFTYSMKKDIEIPGLGRIKFNLHEHEAGISPVLKLQALKKLPAAGMIRVKGIHIPDADKESTCDYEISCSYDNLFPIDTSEIIEPKVLSVDIEANSTITSAMPDASRPNDKVFQIGLTSLVNKVRKKLLFSLGNPDPKKVGLDVELRTFKTEADLLVALTDYIHEEKFNIIIGYNILGWDFQYMISRAKYTKCFSEFDMMGTLMGKHAAEVAPQFESKAYNAQKLVYLDAEGRLFLDLLPIIKRGGEKLTNYRLKTVTTHFGLPTKDPLTAQDIFRCYREFTPDSLGVVGKYCVQDAYITLLLYEKMQTWYGMCEMAKTAHVPIFYLFSKGTQIQMFSQVMEYCMYNNYVIISNGYVMKDGDEYMGAIVLTPVPGKYKKVISFDFASLYPSIMMAHNIDYATLIPEGDHYMVDKHDIEDYLTEWRQFPCYVKMSSIDMFDTSKNIEEWDTARNKSELQTKIEAMKEKYPGKLVGIFKDKSEIPDEHCHVFCWADHSGCCHDMNRKRLKNGTFSKAKMKIICGQRYYRFIKAEYGGKGVVPTLLESLISRRKMTRADIKTNSKEIKDKLISLIKNGGDDEVVKEFLVEFEKREKDLFCDIDKDVEKAKEEIIDAKQFIERIEFLETTNQILDKRQASYKVCANSMYGAMGVKKGYLPLLPGASSVTYKGRCSIEFISTYIPETYGGVTVYGDTDSSHIYFPHIKNNQDAVDLAEKIVKEIQVFFPLPMKLEFEKIYEKYIILTKKRYMARVANKKGEIIEFIKKGVMLSRRDNCVTGDSLISLSNGTSVRIDTMTNNKNVLGWDGTGLIPSYQTMFKYQGEKECLQITLSDGRVLKCTPEHRILVKNGDKTEWKTADKLNSKDMVICGMESPEDIIYENEKEWVLVTDGYFLTMDDEIARQKTLAYMRILGYVNTDGSLNRRSDGRMDCNVPMGHKIDAEAIIADIELVTGLKPSMTYRDTKYSSFYQVRIPTELSTSFISLQGQEFGDRMNNPQYTWPKFLSHESTPLSVIREFIAGCMGGDGHSPYISKVNHKYSSFQLVQINLFVLSCHVENSDLLMGKMKIFSKMLNKLGVNNKILEPKIYYVHKDKNVEKDKRIRIDITQLDIGNTNFMKTIGFRYCCHKQMRQTAAQSFWRTKDYCLDQRKRLIDLALKYESDKTYKKSDVLSKAKEFIINNEPIINTHSVNGLGQTLYGSYKRGATTKLKSPSRNNIGFVNIKDWFNLIGCIEWFGDTKNKKYAVDRIRYSLPTLSIPVLDIRPIGTQKVYDISVDKTNSFVANGIVVHNCEFARQMYLKASESLLDDVSEEIILNDIIDGINSLFERKYGFKSFVITKSMGRAVYKMKTLPAHVQLAYKMRTRGIEVPVGARIEYLFTTRCMGEKKFAQGDKIEDLDYFAQWRRYLRVDYLYYLEKQLIKPLDELLEVGLGIKNFVKNQYELRMNKWRIMERIKELAMPEISIEGDDDEIVPIKKAVVKKAVAKKKADPNKPKRKRARKIAEIIFDSDDEDYDIVESKIPKIEIIMEDDSDEEVDVREKWAWFSNNEKKPTENIYGVQM